MKYFMPELFKLFHSWTFHTTGVRKARVGMGEKRIRDQINASSKGSRYWKLKNSKLYRRLIFVMHLCYFLLRRGEIHEKQHISDKKKKKKPIMHQLSQLCHSYVIVILPQVQVWHTYKTRETDSPDNHFSLSRLLLASPVYSSFLKNKTKSSGKHALTISDHDDSFMRAHSCDIVSPSILLI